MSLFELRNAIIIYLHIFYLCLLRLLFFSPPVTFYRPPALSPSVRASVHYNVKNTQKRREGTWDLFIYNESKITGGSSNASPTELTKVISELRVEFIFRCNRERRGEKFDERRGRRGSDRKFTHAWRTLYLNAFSRENLSVLCVCMCPRIYKINCTLSYFLKRHLPPCLLHIECNGDKLSCVFVHLYRGNHY